MIYNKKGTNGKLHYKIVTHHENKYKKSDYYQTDTIKTKIKET